VGAYGTGGASSANVAFPLELGLSAARDLWTMADEVVSASSGIGTKASEAVVDWTGPKQAVFLDRRVADSSSATAVAGSLRELARAFATAWSQARGEQDRINHARWVEAEKADDNIFEKGWQWAFGETDYGPPPENPPVPSAPRFEATRDPIHPEHQ